MWPGGVASAAHSCRCVCAACTSDFAADDGKDYPGHDILTQFVGKDENDPNIGAQACKQLCCDTHKSAAPCAAARRPFRMTVTLAGVGQVHCLWIFESSSSSPG